MPDSGSICFADSLDALTFIGFAAQKVPTAMKKLFHRLAPAFVVLIFSCFAFGDDFKSKTIPPSATPTDLPKVHNDQFMVIRNFTQEDSSAVRGVVEVNNDGVNWVPVLSAAFVDQSAITPDVINSIVIAGPANVRVTCGGSTGNCFVSFKKDSN